MKLQWEKHLSIGVAEIDKQHKLLIEKFNEFMSACKKERGDHEVFRLFSFLDAYVITPLPTKNAL